MAINLFDFTSLTTPVSYTADNAVQQVLNKIVGLLLLFAYPLAFIGLVYTAWQLITSIGDPNAYTKARQNIITITIGIAILTLGLFVVHFIYSLFGRNA